MRFNIVFILFVAANLLGVLVGMMVYYPQIAAANPLLWVFIPDCPLYVFLAVLCYLGIVKDELLKTITAIGLAKYGLWTVFALLYYNGYFFSDISGWILVPEHIAMALQGAFFAKAFDKRHIAIAAGWFLLNDYADYALGVHPALPGLGFGAVAAFAVVSSLAIPLIAHVYGKTIGENGIVKGAKALLSI